MLGGDAARKPSLLTSPIGVKLRWLRDHWWSSGNYLSLLPPPSSLLQGEVEGLFGLWA